MKQVIAKLLKKEVKLKEKEIEKLIEIPPNSGMGDFAFPCFILAQRFKKNPVQIASEIKKKIKKLPSGIKEINVSGAYINFFVDNEKITENLVKKVLESKEFGKIDVGKKKNVMIEFSQANTHKAFHIGHIRGTSLGESLCRIFEFFNYKVIRANYQGDKGKHVAKWIWCYKKFHLREKLVGDESWIASIYVDAVRKLAENEEFETEVEIINKKLEDGRDEKLNELWKKTRQLSLKSFEKIYSELGTRFDKYYFESELEKSGKEIVKKLLDGKIAEKSKGAVIMNLEKYNLGVWVLLRQDNTILYSAKDLALAEKKFRDFDLDKSIYVIANEQDLHMQQLFKTLELMKFKFVKKCKHVNYGVVRLPTGKMSSRTGDNILYSDFIREVVNYAKEGVKKKSQKIKKQELEKRALKIAVAAIKYSMLKQSSGKNIIFKKEDALNFEGDTGAYLLYSYARASSILRKAKIKKGKFEIKKLSEEENALVKKVSQFPEIVLNSCRILNPLLIANYCYQLAQIFNEFYHTCPVIGSEQEIFRISLVKCFRKILKQCLDLLGIESVEEM